MAKNQPTKKAAEFEGLQTLDSANEVGLAGLVKAENIDISRKNRIRRRTGRVLDATQASDSGYISDGVGLITNGANLIYLAGDLSQSTIRTDLTLGGDIIFNKFGDRLYYSNNIETGVYENGQDRTLGLVRPDSAPVLSATAGDLDEGRIIGACSFVRDDGQESGLSPVTLLESNGGGVSFSEIPVSGDSSVEYTRIYLSHPNGDQLYRANQVINGVTTSEFRAHQTFLQMPQKTQYLDKPPGFQEIDHHNSRMVYAAGQYLFFSEPFAYELVDLRYNWYDLGERITALGSVPGGLFVATTVATWYLAGADAKDATLRMVADYGAVPKTRRYINGNLLGGDLGDTPLPMWVGGTGFVVGSTSGELINVSEKDFNLPAATKGTAMFRKESGQNHYIAVIKT